MAAAAANRGTATPETLFRLDSKVVLITGASSGIGRDFALTVASAGAAVVVGARRKAKLDDLVREIVDKGGRALALNLDVTKVDACREFVRKAGDHFGRLDVLVNCAGVSVGGKSSLENTEADYDFVMDTVSLEASESTPPTLLAS